MTLDRAMTLRCVNQITGERDEMYINVTYQSKNKKTLYYSAFEKKLVQFPFYNISASSTHRYTSFKDVNNTHNEGHNSLPGTLLGLNWYFGTLLYYRVLKQTMDSCVLVLKCLVRFTKYIKSTLTS